MSLKNNEGSSSSKQREILCLFGIKHSGKSSIGRLLAEKKQLQFFDLDEIITGEFAEDGETLRELYRRLGKEAFRRLEAEAASSLLEQVQKNDPRTNGLKGPAVFFKAVAALGGGIMENREAVRRLKPACVMLYLQEEAEILYRRIEAGGIPPFLDPARPYQSFLELYNRRHRLALDTADIVFSLEGRNPEQSAESIIERLYRPEQHHEKRPSFPENPL
ncbi:MAG: shikimate kinase [Spirochaetales bacterium]|nr:shikimate kinase [Spirochaetales bacterium]MCF7938730.1 shikimate kinase [Spirochaetales bacterium]